MTPASDWVATAHRDSPWEQVHVVVLGVGLTGFAAADALIHLGARVSVLADSVTEADRERIAILEVLDATLRTGPGATDELPADADLLITSPGVPPSHPLLLRAAEQGLPVWGEVELAWRLRGADAAPWLAVTGTNGKTTTVRMLASMLQAGGLRVAATGNVGYPIVSAVMDPAGYDVIAVELSSFQLHWSSSLSVHSAAVLNIAPDHLDWHGSVEAYTAAKAKIYENVHHACVYNVDDPATEAMVREADVVEGARAIGFTLGTPTVGMLGVVEDLLVDRAFIPERRTSAAELAGLADVVPAAPHNVANALAAAALARSFGVSPRAVREGLRSFVPEPHRMVTVAEHEAIRWVDDSKATNAHAAEASISAYPGVVWVAGGLAKGADFDGLVTAVGDRLRGVVLLGQDRAVIADALRRHAPQVPVVDVTDVHNGPMEQTTPTEPAAVMDRVVDAAARLATPGDTVLLAPACASWDMFPSYAARGDAFADAVRRHVQG